MPEKRLQSSDICLKAKESLNFDTLKLFELFINFYSNLTNYLVGKLTATAKIFVLESAEFFYNNTFKLKYKKFSNNPNKHHLKSAKKVRYKKAAWLDNLAA